MQLYNIVIYLVAMLQIIVKTRSLKVPNSYVPSVQTNKQREISSSHDNYNKKTPPINK